MNFDPYEELDVDSKATYDEIKAAYHKRARETHPDTGGDRDLFERAKLAWDVLSDEETRKKYDEGGFVDGILKSNFENTALERVTEFFVNIIEQSLDQNVDLNTLDLIHGGVASFRIRINQSSGQIAYLERKINHYNKAIRRLKCKTDTNPIKKTLQNHLSNYRRMIDGNREDIRINERAIEILKDYEFLKDDQLLRHFGA